MNTDESNQKHKIQIMNKKENICIQATYWTRLSQRYFEADLSDEEENALMRFVASEASRDPRFGEPALSLFGEVRATMSLITVGRMAVSAQSEEKTDERLPEQNRSGGPLSSNVIRWVTGIAAAVVMVFVLSRWLRPGDDDIYVASVNGTLITDKEKVLDLMHDSWNDIDFQPSTGEMEQQMKEMFEGLD